MKRLMIVLVALFSFTASFAQIKKNTKSTDDSIAVKGVVKVDTAKVNVIAYASDDAGNVNLVMIKGYVLTTYIDFSGTKMQVSANAYTSKWVAIKPDDIYDLRKIDWK